MVEEGGFELFYLSHC